MSDEEEPDVADESETDADADVEAESETDEEQVEGLSDGDFVRLAYTARTVEGDQLVDTTDRELAEEEGVDVEERNIEPRVITLGAGHLFETVEADIEGKEAGDSGTVVVPAEEAFGEYDEGEVRTISAEKLPEDDRYPGAHVDIDNQHGHVETVIGGRARVDFNHPLAGEDVEYEYEIVEEVEDRVDRAKGMLSMFVDADLEMWIETDEVEEETVVEPDEDADEDAEPETEVETVEKETLYIEATPQLTMNQQWMFQKQQIAQDLMDRLELDRVIIQETIEGGGMMGGLGGMMGGMGGGGGDIEEALEDADVDADEIVEELEGDIDIDAEE
ncbi:FKBP-type peptidyl-prolyl cis-trans isomerase [Halalkalicoccus jeotgali]|uniref:peptidylprolyl isomerase n=1 Tax=Halalkalicoccus jeotgali (strain DSM 18796 / CECT 7217 / JCM 14584 / KCTC 4019 / B3) TaxID=795797 RepID=D8J2L5_HALJB|nr:FKBP-type peptidyl-prolyl cis-trans isomerase [Halalkalicoccus jeotgali]ADJ14972.1 peptidyl-prolyl cis-trans isomerase [Halalkalicoccus jeotgali B3]ELY35012.1 FKBP-type peptidylprolyl isomerase [Halalkalicoccus jeotgali B3]